MKKHSLLNKVKVFDKMPQGWAVVRGTSSEPDGYKWISNNKSRFGGEYKAGLIKVSDIREG